MGDDNVRGKKSASVFVSVKRVTDFSTTAQLQVGDTKKADLTVVYGG